MCGRTCLTLSPDVICCTCSYKNKNNKIKKPEWREEYNLGKKYLPSYNVAPTEITPVLVSASHFDSDNKNNDRVIVPMMWGIIPYWHKGDYKKHGLSTNNCRLENMQQSKLYKGLFQKGQRCVILCEGFYEWQTTKGAKPSAREAYYIYMPQENNAIKIENKTDGEENLNLLKIAGLFDIWTNENGDNLFSYTVITFESDENFGWLHHRIPAILETEEQVANWLEYDRVTDKTALSVLSPAKTIQWHRVSNMVNNTRNKSHICNKPIKENSGSNTPSKNTLHSFFTVTKRSLDERDSKSDINNETNPLKKIKHEDTE